MLRKIWKFLWISTVSVIGFFILLAIIVAIFSPKSEKQQASKEHTAIKEPEQEPPLPPSTKSEPPPIEPPSMIVEQQPDLTEEDSSDTTNRKPAGKGFFYENVSFKSGMINEAFGEMTNESRKDYQLVNFTLSLYDNDGKLLEVCYINMSNIFSGDTKSFTAYFDTLISEISSYKIQFENGI